MMHGPLLYPLAAGRRGLPPRENSVAGCALESSQVRRIEDGPYGGTPLMIGGELVGNMITSAPCPSLARGARVRLLSGANGIRFDPIQALAPRQCGPA